jgi:hypothetical protein
MSTIEAEKYAGNSPHPLAAFSQQCKVQLERFGINHWFFTSRLDMSMSLEVNIEKTSYILGHQPASLCH